MTFLIPNNILFKVRLGFLKTSSLSLGVSESTRPRLYWKCRSEGVYLYTGVYFTIYASVCTYIQYPLHTSICTHINV